MNWRARSYNKVLGHLLLPIADKLCSTTLWRHLQEWRSMQFASSAELKQIQHERLRAFLDHVQCNSRYYELRGMRAIGRREPLEVLKEQPLLRKSDVNANWRSILTCDPGGGLTCERTSGSSGTSGVVYYNKDEISINRAIQILWWEWAGYQIGDPVFQLGVDKHRSRSIYKTIKDVLFRTTYQTAFGHTEPYILERLERLRKHPRQLFAGYASSMYLYALVAKKHGLHDISFRAAVSWGDKMFPHFQKLIEDQFHTRVFDTYGCCEEFNIAAQCEFGRYHIMTPHVVVEVVDENGEEVAAGQLGRVVVTRLDNLSFPLVRYEMGDLAVKQVRNESCPCGRSFPALDRIVGRDTDLLKTSNGFLTVQEIVYVLKHVERLTGYRFVQRDYDDVILEYVADEPLSSKDTQNIQTELNTLAGTDVPLAFHRVDNVPSTPSGKPQLIESKL